MSKKAEEEFPPIELAYRVSKEESWELICAKLDQFEEHRGEESGLEELPLDPAPAD